MIPYTSSRRQLLKSNLCQECSPNLSENRFSLKTSIAKAINLMVSIESCGGNGFNVKSDPLFHYPVSWIIVLFLSGIRSRSCLCLTTMARKTTLGESSQGGCRTKKLRCRPNSLRLIDPLQNFVIILLINKMRSDVTMRLLQTILCRGYAVESMIERRRRCPQVCKIRKPPIIIAFSLRLMAALP